MKQEVSVLGNEDFKVNTITGVATISQRKLGEMCGVNHKTVARWVRKNAPVDIDLKEGVIAKYASLCTQHYAEKGNKQAVKSLVRISEFGMDQFIKRAVGYQDKQLPNLSQLQMISTIALELEDTNQQIKLKADKSEVEALKDKVDNFTKVKPKFKSENCNEGYYTISNMVQSLSTAGNPISYNSVVKFLKYYEDGIRKNHNCYHRDDVDSLLQRVVSNSYRISAHRMLDPESEISFKADWL